MIAQRRGSFKSRPPATSDGAAAEAGGFGFKIRDYLVQQPLLASLCLLNAKVLPKGIGKRARRVIPSTECFPNHLKRR
jgi:hypothetical protein